MVVAKQRKHLFSENIETLFMLASLKLLSRKLSEYEEEIKFLEGHLKWLEFNAFILKLFYILLFCFSSACENHLHTKCYFFFPRLPQILWEPEYRYDLRGWAWQKRGGGGVFLRRFDTSIHTMDWPEIRKSEIPMSEFHPKSGDWAS